MGFLVLELFDHGVFGSLSHFLLAIQTLLDSSHGKVLQWVVSGPWKELVRVRGDQFGDVIVGGILDANLEFCLLLEFLEGFLPGTKNVLKMRKFSVKG